MNSSDDPHVPDDADAPTQTQRLDKWLWFTRAVKSRTLAASLVTSGKVRVNRSKTDKPSHVLKIGDVITLSLRGKVRILQVIATGTRRGPHKEAVLLYSELTPETPSDQAIATENNEPTAGSAAPTPKRAPGAGRPTKKERRQLDQLHRDIKKL